jgi:hypothetical protein
MAYTAGDGLKLSRADLEDLTDEVNRARSAQFDRAMRDQAKAMRARREVAVDRKAECVPELSIHPTIYHRLGQMFGYKIWSDPDFVRYVHATIECRTRTKVANPSFRVELPSRKKFSKSYGAI